MNVVGLAVAVLTGVGFAISTSAQHHARASRWRGLAVAGTAVACIESHKTCVTGGPPPGTSTGNPMRPVHPQLKLTARAAACGQPGSDRRGSHDPSAERVPSVRRRHGGPRRENRKRWRRRVLAATPRLTDASTAAFVSAAAAEFDRVRGPDDEFVDLAA